MYIYIYGYAALLTWFEPDSQLGSSGVEFTYSSHTVWVSFSFLPQSKVMSVNGLLAPMLALRSISRMGNV